MKNTLGSAILKYSNEKDVSRYCVGMMTDAIEWVNEFLKKDFLTLSEEYQLGGQRPDCIFIRGPIGTPVGLMEVKMPSEKGKEADLNVVTAPKLLGQGYDYLKLLKTIGVENPFAILTTYDHFLISWLPESDDFAASTDFSPSRVAAPSASSSSSETTIPRLGSIDAAADSDPTSSGQAEEEDLSDSVQGGRLLHGTKPIRYDAEELPRHLVSFLLKLCFTIIQKREPNKTDLYYMAKENVYVWQKLKKLPNPSAFPRSNTRSFFLLEVLGHGIEGKVWKACTHTGATCAVKIFYGPSTKIEAELNLWTQVFNIKGCFKTTLINSPALIMPVVSVLPPKEITDLHREATLKALETLDSFKKFHSDLEWRHVGYMEDGNGTLTAVLLDFTEGTWEEKVSLQEMIEKLDLKLD